MDIRVLGCYGSQLPGYNMTSFLIDGKMLVDGGTITSALSMEEQARIDHILVTHAHLDHVRDIMFLADNINISACRDFPVTIVSTEGILNALKEHLFNDAIWPDFSVIPDEKKPTIRFRPIQPEMKLDLGGFSITAVRVNHSIECVGYVVGFGDSSVIFIGDTGPTERIWQVAGELEKLKAVFVETSLRDEMSSLALASGHLTPASLGSELDKLKDTDTDIYLFHMKPMQGLDSFKEAIRAIKNRNIRLLSDGDVIRL